MLKCRKTFGSPLLLIQHVLECEDTCKGEWKCLDPACHDKHALQRWSDTQRALMSPVHLLRRLSVGRKRGRHPSADQVPSGNKGRVGDTSEHGVSKTAQAHLDLHELATSTDTCLELSGSPITPELVGDDPWLICSNDTNPYPSMDEGTVAGESAAWENHSQVTTLWSGSLAENTERGTLTSLKYTPGEAAGGNSLAPSALQDLGHASHFSSGPQSAMISCPNLTIPQQAVETVSDLSPMTWYDVPQQYGTPTIADHSNVYQPSFGDPITSPHTAYNASHIGFRQISYGQSSSITPFGAQETPWLTPDHVPTYNVPKNRRESAPQEHVHPHNNFSQGAGFSSLPCSAVTGRMSFGEPEPPAAYQRPTPMTKSGVAGGRFAPSGPQAGGRGAGGGELRTARAPRAGRGPGPGPTAFEAAGWDIDTMMCSAEASGFHACPWPGCGHRPTGKDKNRRSHLKRHMATHLTSNRLQCPQPRCRQTLAAGRLDNLQAHLRNVHHMDAAAIQLSGTTVVETASVDAREAGEAGLDAWSSFYDDDSLDTGVWGQDGEANLPGGHTIPQEYGVLNGIASESEFDPMEIEEDSLLTGCENERPSLDNLGATAWRN